MNQKESCQGMQLSLSCVCVQCIIGHAQSIGFIQCSHTDWDQMMWEPVQSVALMSAISEGLCQAVVTVLQSLGSVQYNQLRQAQPTLGLHFQIFIPKCSIFIFKYTFEQLLLSKYVIFSFFHYMESNLKPNQIDQTTIFYLLINYFLFYYHSKLYVNVEMAREMHRRCLIV